MRERISLKSIMTLWRESERVREGIKGIITSNDWVVTGRMEVLGAAQDAARPVIWSTQESVPGSGVADRR